MSQSLTINLPLRVIVSGRKDFILNLNNYRNAHYQTLNKAKKNYSTIVRSLIDFGHKGLFKGKQVQISYVYFHPDKRRIDAANPVSIIDKFACDALTEHGLWDDDDVSTIVRGVWVFGGVDKDNPRCEMIIEAISGDLKP
jgi:Holliday junction resolvase RusA-like endonuclease